MCIFFMHHMREELYCLIATGRKELPVVLRPAPCGSESFDLCAVVTNQEGHAWMDCPRC